MITCSIDRDQPDPGAMAQAVEVLRRGGVIVYPTDTCYGLGCDARNPRAMAKIAAMKGRDAAKKFSVIIRSVESIDQIAIVSDTQRAILSQYLPGPFTFIVLNADFRVASTNTLGIRVPDCPTTQALSAAFAEPYITTSANRSGTGALYSLAEIQDNLLQYLSEDEQPDLALDAGELPRNDTSTVVDLTTTPPSILRQGSGTFA